MRYYSLARSILINVTALTPEPCASDKVRIQINIALPASIVKLMSVGDAALNYYAVVLTEFCILHLQLLLNLIKSLPCYLSDEVFKSNYRERKLRGLEAPSTFCKVIKSES